MNCHCVYSLLVLFLLTTIQGVESERWFNLSSEYSTIPMFNGNPANVSLQLEFNQLIAMAASMEAEIAYFLNLRWYDYRFVKNGCTASDTNYVTLFGSEPGWEFIWRPDIYMSNEIPSGLLDFIPTDYIRVYENGTLTMSTRHMVAFYCKIRLFKLPMTPETCLLQFLSNSYTTDEMNLSWFEGLPVAYSDDFVSLVSRIDSTVTTKCSGQSGPHDEKRPCLLIALNIDQVYKGFIVQVYLPSSAIIFMVWLGFWIHVKEVSGRVRVVSMTFVAMVTQMVGVMVVFPDTVQVEPLLIWNGFCLGMNLLAFVEFIVVHNMYIASELKKKQSQKLDVEAPPSSTSTNMSNGNAVHTGNSGVKRIQVAPHDISYNRQKTTRSRWKCWQITPFRLDRICMVAYIMTFFIFNIVYWTSFML